MKKLILTICLIQFFCTNAFADMDHQTNLFLEHINEDIISKNEPFKPPAENELEYEDVTQIVINISTEKDVLALLGKPQYIDEDHIIIKRYGYHASKINAGVTFAEHIFAVPLMFLVGPAYSPTYLYNRGVEIYFNELGVVSEYYYFSENKSVHVYLDEDGKVKKDYS